MGNDRISRRSGRSGNRQFPEADVPDFQWVGIDLLEERLALPAAFKTYYQVMKTLHRRESRYESDENKSSIEKGEENE